MMNNPAVVDLLNNTSVIFLIQVALFSLPPFYIAVLRQPHRSRGMYVYAGIVLVIGGFLGAVYSIPLAESITISGGSLAYGALLYSTILLVIIEGDLLAIRNVIRLVITVNVLKFALFSTLSWLLGLEIIINPFNTVPDLFGVSAKFMILGGALIILELLILLFLFEKIKVRVKNIYLLSLLYTICFVGVLCLDGVLFPLLALGFDAALVGIVVGDVTGKFLMAMAYSLPILAFLLMFRNRLTTYLETPLHLGSLLTASRETLLKEIDRQQRSLESERQQHKLKLLETTQLIEKTFTSLNEAVLVIDPAERRIVTCNPAVEQVFGYAPAELIGQPTAILYNSQEDFEQFGALGEPSLTRTGKFETEYIMRHKDGRSLTTEHVVTSLGDRTNWEKGVVSVVRDVTARKAAETALQQSETRYRSLFEYSPVAQWEEDFSQAKNAVAKLLEEGVTDLEAYLEQHDDVLLSLIRKVKVLDVNRQTVELYGVESKAHFLGQLKIGHPDLVRSFIKQAVAIAEGKTSLNFASLAYKADGERMHIIFDWSVLPGHEKDYSRVIVSIVDVTAVVKAEQALEENRRRLQALFDHSQDAFLLADDQGNYVDVNPAACELTGYSRQELLQMAVWEITPEPRVAEGQKMWQAFIEAGTSRGEYTVQTKNGRLIETEFRAVANIATGLHLSIMRDITERKQAEKALRQRNQFIETILDNLPIGLAVNFIDEGVTVYMNTEFEEIYGWPREALADIEQFFQLVYPDPDYRQQIMGQVMADIESGDPDRMEWEGMGITTQYGEKRIISAKNIPIYEQNFMISLVQDITARKQAELELRETNEQLRAIIEASPLAIMVLTLEGKVTLWSPAAERIFGWRAEEVMGQSYPLADTLALAEEFARHLQAAADNQTINSLETWRRHKNGDLIAVSLDLAPVAGSQGEATAVVGIIADITARKQAQEQLQEYTQRLEELHQAEQKQRILAETLQQTAVTLVGSLNLEETLNTILTQLGQVVRYDLAKVLFIRGEMLVVGALRGALASEVVVNKERPYTQIPLLNRSIQSGETVLLTADQIKQSSLNLPGIVPALTLWVGIPLIARDIAVGYLTVGKVDPAHQPQEINAIQAFAQQAALAIEKATILSELEKSVQTLRETQAQLVRAARLSAIGETAAGVAHQINNPLTTVIVDSHLLQKNLPASHPAHQSAAAIHQAALRAAAIVERLLDFSLTKPTRKEPVDISQSVHESITLLKAHLPENVQIQSELDSELPLVAASPAHLQDVWLNLLINARDAVKEVEQGLIRVSVNHKQQNHTLEVTIEDNGPGIAHTEQKKIFVPFYTTKPQGTGLGLAVCQDIIMHHGGEVSVSSIEGQGSKFTVVLPL